MRIFSLSFAALFMLLNLSAAYAAEVLIVTWQGKLVSEAAFEKRLKELVPDVNFTHIDAKRKKGHLAKALRGVDLEKIDLVYSFGTTGTKIVQQFVKGQKPQVFNIVSAPVLSGIAESIEKPGKNITGAKLQIDFKMQLDVLEKLRDYKTLGVLFDPREKQNAVVLKAFKRIMAAKGKTLVPIRIIPDSGQGDKMISSMVSKANGLDAIYIIASSSFSGLYDKMLGGLDPKLLVMSTVSTVVESGATVALGVAFEERGRAVAEQAAKILKGANAGDLPVSVVTRKQARLFVNRVKMHTAGLKNIAKQGMIIKLLSPLKDD